MTDRIFRKILYEPRNGQEMMKACPPGTRLYLYSALSSDSRDALDIMLSMGRNNLILLQNPMKPNTGHWISLSFNPEKKEAYFFSSYGGRPDSEKLLWLTTVAMKISGQMRNILSDGLRELFLLGWKIYFNDFAYQKQGDQTATCGIWTAAFLNSGMNPDEFALKHRQDPIYYYFKLFCK